MFYLKNPFFSQCAKVLLTTSSIKQRNGNHYAKTYPDWEETEV